MQKTQLIGMNLERINKLENSIYRSTDFRKITQYTLAQIIKELKELNLGYVAATTTRLNRKKKMLKHISMHEISKSKNGLKSLGIDFKDTSISLSSKNNANVKVLKSKKSSIVTNLFDVFHPPLKIDEAKELQKALKIQSNVVFPIIVENASIGTVVYSTKTPKSEISKNEVELLQYFTRLISISIQNTILYESLEQKENEISRANNQLSETIARKDEFISVTSHELKTPISIANNNLWMFRNVTQSKFGNDEAHYLKSAEMGLSRMQKIVDNLLDLSRIQDNRLELDINSYDIYELTNDVVKTFKDLAEKKGLKLTISRKMVSVVETDGPRFQEILENLVSNAIKYTEEGFVEVIIEDRGTTYKISVKDSGHGISDHDKVKIFKKFGQASEGLKLSKAGASTGLGLYIAKNFIEQMDGTIGFESESEKGSTFWIEIPKMYKGKNLRKDLTAHNSKVVFVRRKKGRPDRTKNKK